MSDEKLRLEAEVRDNMSGPLRKIREQLNSIRMSPGMQAATDQMKKLGAETKNFVGGGSALSSTLDAIGVGGLATAGSLAAVVVQMRALGERSLQMKELARETGVSAGFLNAWEHAGSNFGVSADAMDSSLTTLTQKMVQFKLRTSELNGLVASRWPNLAKQLLGDNPEQQLHDIIAFADKIGKIQGPQVQKDFLSEFFGNGADMEKLMRDGAKGFFDELQRMQKSLNPISPDLLKQAQAFREATTAFNVSLDNFENTAGPAFLKTMTGLVDEAKAITDTLDGKPPNPSEPKKLWGDLSKGDISAFGTELGHVFVNSVRAELGLSPDKVSGTEAPKIPYLGRNAHYHKSSYSGNDAGSLFHRASYSDDGAAPAQPRLMRGADVGLAGIIEDGTKSGVLAAFREMMATNSAGGIENASFETGGGADNSPVAAGRRIRQHELGNSDSADLPDDGAAPRGLGHVGQGMAARAKETYDFWRKAGMSREAALGFVGNEQGETGLTGGPKLHWDGSHYSGGLVQWDPTRRAAIQKALGIDVWHDTNHAHQLEAESWELRQKYPKLFEALRHAKTIGQAAGALVQHYELPADKYGQSRYRAGMGAAWAKRLQDGDPPRRATGLASNPATSSAKAAAAAEGRIRADIHVHGNAHKATVRSTDDSGQPSQVA